MGTPFKWVIGHRGACGYWPENTLASIAGAHGLGADMIEVDVVLSRDGEAVLSHDLHLEPTTDVAVRFPGRARADGRFYAVDFDWSELLTLRARARVDVETGGLVYPSRVMRGEAVERLCRLGEALVCVADLNRQTGRRVALVVEVKMPAWHRREGRDVGQAVREVLARAPDGVPLVVETFDPVELRRWRAQWTELSGCGWWQLLGENDWGEAECDYDVMRTAAGLRVIAGYADGVGVNIERVTPDFLASAKMCGLSTFGYTARVDVGGEELRSWLLGVGLEGVFTDQPDVVRSWRDEA